MLQGLGAVTMQGLPSSTADIDMHYQQQWRKGEGGGGGGHVREMGGCRSLLQQQPVLTALTGAG